MSKSFVEEVLQQFTTCIDTASTTIGQETAEELQKLTSDTSLIEKTVESIMKSIDSRLNTLSESVSDLKKELINMNNSDALQSKIQILESVISNAGINPTDYIGKDITAQPIGSTEYIKSLINPLIMGFGILLLLVVCFTMLTEV